MSNEHIAAALARCDAEIAEMRSQPAVEKAYLTTMGIEDWEAEKRLLIQSRSEEMGGAA